MFVSRITKPLTTGNHEIWHKGYFIYFFFFFILAVLYIGAYRGGWVYDTVEWLHMVREMPFGDYINLAHHNQLSHYQITQLVTWLLYQIIGTNRIGWLLIHISIQAANAALLFSISKRMLADAGVSKAHVIAVFGAVLFCTSPYISEPIVYKAAFHFLLACCLFLLVLYFLIQYLQTANKKWALPSVIIFLLSIFSLEFFYLTPLFCLCIVLFYRSLPGFSFEKIKGALLLFCLPEIVLLVAHRVVILAIFRSTGLAHNLAELNQPLTFYAIKPSLCLFHLFGGRFLPQSVRDAYHHLACNYFFAGLFFAALLIAALRVILGIRNFKPEAKVASLFFFLLLVALGFASLVWFPENGYIYCDRYIYILLPFFFILLSISIYSIPYTAIRNVALLAVILLNLAGSIYVCVLWKQSAGVLDKLQSSIPPLDKNTDIILLNNPWSFKGAPMSGNREGQDFGSMHNELYPGPTVPLILQVSDYDMQHADDGAHVRVMNDSTVRVMLNQDNSWMNAYNPAKNYAVSSFRMELLDSKTYLLHLRDPSRPFRLWYQTGSQLRVVDMAARQEDQW